jgi:hypothetical protein
MKKKTRLLRSVILLTLMIAAAAFVQAQADKRKPAARVSFHTPLLRSIDKVELMSIYSRMGDIERVDATRLVQGQDAQNLLRVWRKQRFLGYSPAICHQPPYAIKFYSKDKLVLFATVCWACSNVTFVVPKMKHWVEFEHDSQAAKMLREIFQKAFPSETKFG